jgi:biotin carboxyl carrier protein
MRRYTVTVDGTPFTIDIEETAADRFTVTVGDRTFEASLEASEDLPGAVITPGMPLPVAQPERVPEHTPPGGPPAPAVAPAPAVRAVTRRGVTAGAAASSGPVVAAPMPGVVLEVLVAAGAHVVRGDPLLVLEAMKMRNTIRAPRAGIVVEVTTEAGRPVVAGEPLLRLGDAPQ